MVLQTKQESQNEGVLGKMGVYMFKPSLKFICVLSNVKVYHDFNNQHMSRYTQRHAISSKRMRCEGTYSPASHKSNLTLIQHFESFDMKFQDLGGIIAQFVGGFGDIAQWQSIFDMHAFLIRTSHCL